jgi:hypothetical protein
MHYLDVLSQRIATAPDAVQRVLENKLDTALTELEQRLEKPQPATNGDEAPRPAAPLAALNQYIGALKRSGRRVTSGSWA